MNEHTKPNVFIIGFPKCGTTTVSNYLSQHSEFFYAQCSQEPQYFHEDFAPKFRKFNNEKKYLDSCYRDAGGYTCIGESTPNYIYSDVALTNILAMSPDAKIIVMLRDIPEMLYSLYRHNVRNGRENADTFSTAWKRSIQSKENLNNQVTDKGDTFLTNYQIMGSVGFYLERVFVQVSREQIHTIYLDDLKQNPRKTYINLLKFLKLSEESREDFQPHNTGNHDWRYKWMRKIMPQLFRWKKKIPIKFSLGLTKKLKKSVAVEKVDTELRNEINDFFEKDRNVVMQLTDIRLK